MLYALHGLFSLKISQKILDVALNQRHWELPVVVLQNCRIHYAHHTDVLVLVEDLGLEPREEGRVFV